MEFEMPWCKSRTKTYFDYGVKINGKVHHYNLGDGPEAVRVAGGIAARRRGRLDVAEARAEIKLAVARLRRLGSASHDLMVRAGYYKVGAKWRRRGIITMNMLDKSISVREALAREKARRHFLEADDQDAEINRYLIDVADLHLDGLAARVVPGDAMRQEAIKLDIRRAATELGGPDPSAIVAALALTVAMLKVEYDLASFRYMVAVDEERDTPVGVTSELRKWRDFACRRFTSAAKAIAFIRKLQLSDVESNLGRLRVVG
jgi:hypothetical protein